MHRAGSHEIQIPTEENVGIPKNFQPVHHQFSIDSTSTQADMALSQGPKTSFNLTHVLCELQNCSPLT